ncbi:hypothetical protein OFC18_31900, partial [Escherichia coli]|nr:hypothetical protein [Escherichia coli]
ESRRTKQLKIIVIKYAELEYGNTIVQYISRKLHLHARHRVGGRRPETPIVSKSIKTRKWTPGQGFSPAR